MLLTKFTSPLSSLLFFSWESWSSRTFGYMPYCSSWQKDCESADGLILPVKPQQMQIWPNSLSIYNKCWILFFFLCKCTVFKTATIREQLTRDWFVSSTDTCGMCAFIKNESRRMKIWNHFTTLNHTFKLFLKWFKVVTRMSVPALVSTELWGGLFSDVNLNNFISVRGYGEIASS